MFMIGLLFCLFLAPTDASAFGNRADPAYAIPADFKSDGPAPASSYTNGPTPTYDYAPSADFLRTQQQIRHDFDAHNAYLINPSPRNTNLNYKSY